MVTKRLLCILLSVFLATAIVTGCSQGDDPEQQDTSESAGQSDGRQDEDNAPVEKVRIKWVGWTPLPFKAEGSWGETCIEQEFPEIDMMFKHLERGTWTDQLTTMILGGDIPDIILMKDRAMVVKYATQEVLAQLDFDEIKEYMPKYFSSIREVGIDHWLGTVVNNKVYALPSAQRGNEYSEYAFVYRKDWLENVGLDVPETLEEYEEVLKRFTFDDPDKNDKDDTYGSTEAAMIENGMKYSYDYVFAAFGIMNGAWNRTEDGSLEYGLLMDEAKSVFKVVNRWFENGYIDPEFVTNDERVATQKQINGVIGAFGWSGIFNWWSEREDRDAGVRARAARKINTEAEFVFGYPPVGENGKRGWYDFGNLKASYAMGVHIEKEDKKRHLIMQLLEKKAVDPEFVVKMEYGIEGEHYEVIHHPETKTYQYKYLHPYNQADGWTQLSPNGLFAWSYTNEGARLVKGKYDDIEKIYGRKNNVLPGVDYFPYIDMFVDNDTTGMVSELQAIADKWQIEFITGSKSVDENWNEFVNEWNNAGGNELREIINSSARETIDSALEFINSNMN